ncbi:MAG: hypothetical protein GTN36_02690 [Candidatus Aenigmarchaeota archaeon]|nr:hypothetical protein [Candidatus Aenigmarchaeota archaeon]
MNQLDTQIKKLKTFLLRSNSKKEEKLKAFLLFISEKCILNNEILRSDAKKEYLIFYKELLKQKEIEKWSKIREQLPHIDISEIINKNNLKGLK